ncbi:MAG: alanine racemase [Gemmatimonadota bacterium]
MSTNPKGRSWLDVRADALLANLARLRSALDPEVRVLPMVKADAYGVGMPGVVETLRAAGVWGFGVATVEEGLRLRQLGVEGPVVVLSPSPYAEIDAAVEGGLALSVGSLDALREVAAAAERSGRVADVHLDVDTGMGRSGVDWRQGAAWLDRFRSAATGSVRWAGIFTHLHSAEDDAESVQRQAERFGAWTAEIEPHVLRHMLNSAGVLHAPESAGDLVRPGIFLYGGRCGSDVPAPDPVVSLRARVVHVRDAVPGTTVGYGATYTAARGERWATLSIGYGDGLPRALGNRGHALIGGRRTAIVGRISMDVTVVNITGMHGVGVGDVATLIGRDGAEEITLDEVAEGAGTISYEVLTGFTTRLPRVWEGKGKDGS